MGVLLLKMFVFFSLLEMFQDLCLTSSYTTWLAEGEDEPRSGSHSRLFSELIVIGAVNIIGVLTNPYLYCFFVAVSPCEQLHVKEGLMVVLF